MRMEKKITVPNTNMVKSKFSAYWIIWKFSWVTLKIHSGKCKNSFKKLLIKEGRNKKRKKKEKKSLLGASVLFETFQTRSISRVMKFLKSTCSFIFATTEGLKWIDPMFVGSFQENKKNDKNN